MSFSDRFAKRYGYPELIEQLVISTTPAYSVATLFPGEMVRVVVTDETYLKFVPEYVFGGKFGDEGYEPARYIFDSDAEDAEFSNLNWDMSESPDQTVVTLNKTSPIAGLRDLEFCLDDQDTILKIPLNGDINGNSRVFPTASEAMILRIRHLDSDVLKLLQWMIQESGDGTTGVQYWDDGGGVWTTTPTWNDLTGSATDATHSFTWTTDQTRKYQLKLRPKADYASETCKIDSVSCFPSMTSATGSLLDAEIEYFFEVNFRCKLAFDCTADAQTAIIDRMIAHP